MLLHRGDFFISQRLRPMRVMISVVPILFGISAATWLIQRHLSRFVLFAHAGSDNYHSLFTNVDILSLLLARSSFSPAVKDSEHAGDKE